MKIAAIVFNSVRHDNRVVREALSLAEAGHDVSILGIRNKRAALPLEELAPGCRIIRVRFRSDRERIVQRFWFLVSIIPVLTLGWIFLHRPDGPERRIVEKVASICRQGWDLLRDFPDRAILASIAGLILLAALQRLRSASRRRRAFLKMEGEEIRAGLIQKAKDFLHAAVVLPPRALQLRIVEKEVFAELDRIRPDVIHCHDLLTLPMGARYKKVRDCLLVYDSHEIFEESSWTSWLPRTYYRRLQTRHSGAADGFISTCDEAAEILKGRYPLLPKATIISNAASVIPGRKIGKYDGRLHRAAGLEEEHQILLYQGGFTPFRGLDHLISSATRLPSGWKIVLMGWGRLEKRLKSLAKREDPLGDRIFFLPPVPRDELLLWSQGAAVGIIPYEDSCLNHRYCSPNKLWEYPAAGVPILASPLPVMARTISENEIGWLLEPWPSAETIAIAISKITPEDLRRKKKNCAAFIERDNWRVYEERLVKLYADMIPEGHEAKR